MKIDLKSAVCGLAVGVLAMFAIGATEQSNGPGRYSVAIGSNHDLVIDTQTGRVWNLRLTNAGDIKGTDADFYSPKIDK